VAPLRANKRYLELLKVAAEEGEARTDDALRLLLEQGELGEGKLNGEALRALLQQSVPPPTQIAVADVALESFDELLGGTEGRQ